MDFDFFLKVIHMLFSIFFIMVLKLENQAFTGTPECMYKCMYEDRCLHTYKCAGVCFLCMSSFHGIQNALYATNQKQALMPPCLHIWLPNGLDPADMSFIMLMSPMTKLKTYLVVLSWNLQGAFQE